MAQLIALADLQAASALLVTCDGRRICERQRVVVAIRTGSLAPGEAPDRVTSPNWSSTLPDRMACAAAWHLAGRTDEAIDHYRRIVDGDPSATEAWRALARLLSPEQLESLDAAFTARSPEAGTAAGTAKVRLPLLRRAQRFSELASVLDAFDASDVGVKPNLIAAFMLGSIGLNRFGQALEMAATAGCDVASARPVARAQLRAIAGMGDVAGLEALLKAIEDREGVQVMHLLCTSVGSHMLPAGRVLPHVAWLVGGPSCLTFEVQRQAIVQQIHASDPAVLELAAAWLAKRPVDEADRYYVEVMKHRARNIEGDTGSEEQLPVYPRPDPVAERDLATLARAEASAARAWMKTGLSRMQAVSLTDWIAARIRTGEPTSFVRLGDGEAIFLPDPHAEADPVLRAGWLRRRSSMQTLVWWGRDLLSPQEGDALGRRLEAIMSSHDVIGIAPDLRLRRAREPGEDAEREELNSMGLLMRTIERQLAEGRGPRRVTSAFAPGDLDAFDLYDRMFAPLSSVSVISARPIAPTLKERFGLSVRTDLRITGEARWREAFHEPEGPPIWPDLFRRIDAAIDPRPGEVFLIGAGFLGKFWCDTIRSRGGIAIDLGSQMDRWAGHVTRPF